jgi:hypothetical protein
MNRTKEDILKPYVETPFRHTKIVDKDNAIKAMEEYANEVMKTNGKGWISTKEQTPPDYKRVMYFDSRDKNISVGYFVWSQTPVDYVTHWMDLPPNPVE